MEIEPAHINQVMMDGGQFVEIGADVGMVADDLRRIDPSLRVRLRVDVPQPFFAIYGEEQNGRQYLIFTVNAHQNRSGTWEGLDQRVVRRIERIGSDDYNFADEIQNRNLAAAAARRQLQLDQIEALNYDGYRRLREMVGRNCAHMSVSRDLTVPTQV
jgi:hypothetical protein